MSNQVYTSIYKVKNVKELKDIEKWRNNTFDSPVKHGKNHDDEFSKLKKSEKNYRTNMTYCNSHARNDYHGILDPKKTKLILLLFTIFVHAKRFFAENTNGPPKKEL